MRRCSLILLGFAWLVAMPAHAEFRAASEAFRAGLYDAAFAEAGIELTADANAFRARALLAKAMCGEGDPPRALLDQALAEAEAGLALDAQHAESRLQKAIALSLIVRPMGLSEARRTGYGELSRSLAESVVASDPGNHYAHGLLAVWHVEVVRRGGMVGSSIMGASVKSGQRHFSQAVSLAPDDIGLRWQWARALAAHDVRKYRGEIEGELKAATALDPATELDRVMQGRAAELLAALDRDTARQVESRSQRML